MTKVRLEITAPRRYTLDEARAEIARQTCLNEGHAFETVVDLTTNEPTAVMCDHCGKSWSVRA